MYNKSTLIGNVGKDPEIRTTNNGDKVASFSLATSESWKDKATGEKKTKTQWHNIVVFGNTANYVESYVKKGAKLMIEGPIETRSWDDKSGNTKYMTEIVLRGFNGKLLSLDSKPKDQGQKFGDHLNDETPF